MADTSGTHYFDRAYTLDALGRVLGETRGDWDVSAIDTTREERNWALTAMGNWASRDIDLDGAGIDFGARTRSLALGARMGSDGLGWPLGPAAWRWFV